MDKRLAGIVTFGLATLMTSAAQAQDGSSLPAEGSFILSAERVFGFYKYKFNEDYTTTGGTKHEIEANGTQFSLLWGGSPNLDTHVVNIDAVPRIAADYMITDMISLGGSLGYYSQGGDWKVKATPPGAENTGDLPDVSAFVIAPRVGFMLPINETVGFWPRAGFTYYHQTVTEKDTENGVTVTDETKGSGEQLNLEGMFFISPVEHFAFVLGPVIDIGVGGSSEETYSGGNGASVTDPKHDVKLTVFGAAFGLAGYF